VFFSKGIPLEAIYWPIFIIDAFRTGSLYELKEL
jgi:hypothetical protein